MKHILVLLALCLAVVTTGCKEKENSTIILPRFTVEADNIVSWEEGTDFIKITLDDPGAYKFKQFNEQNLGQKIEIYLGPAELFSPKMDSLVRGNDIFLAKLTVDQKASVAGQLPPGKKIAK